MMIIDRFEGDFAILEDSDTGAVAGVERSLITGSPCEGDVVESRDGVYIVNAEATSARRANIAERLKRMGL